MTAWFRNLFEPVDPWTDEERSRQAASVDSYRRPFKQADDPKRLVYYEPGRVIQVPRPGKWLGL